MRKRRNGMAHSRSYVSPVPRVSPQAGRGDQLLSDILVFWYSGNRWYIYFGIFDFNIYQHSVFEVFSGILSGMGTFERKYVKECFFSISFYLILTISSLY